MKQFAILIISILIFSACNKVIELNEKDLIGTWQNTFLKVEMKSFRNTKIDTILELKEKQWLEIMRIKPIKTSYLKDGTYVSKFYNKSDQEIHKVTGNWSFSNDSLILEQLKPVKLTTAFKTEIKDNIASFKGMVDWDMDKNNDDIYLSLQKKID